MKPILRKITPNPQTSLNIRIDKGKNLLNNWHYHPELELVYIKKISGTRLVGDNLENYHHYDMVLLGSDLPHSFNHDKKYINRKGAQAPEAIVIHFQKEFLGPFFWDIPEMKEIAKIIYLSRQGLKIVGKTRKQVAVLMSKMIDATPAMRVISLLQILEEIAAKQEYQLLASKGYNYSESYDDNDKLSRIYQYTFENFSKKIRIDDIASLLLLSPQSFCRYFKLKTRRTYFDFLVEVRIGHACRMLLDNELSVSEICYSCGYNNISHFNHQFKKVTGKSPLQYQLVHSASQCPNHTIPQ
jgi:AraC-like DNA-binding protein